MRLPEAVNPPAKPALNLLLKKRQKGNGDFSPFLFPCGIEMVKYWKYQKEIWRFVEDCLLTLHLVQGLLLIW